MTTNELRWGLLCTANINRRLIPAIRAAERNELTAVASRSSERAETYAAEWGIPRFHGSYPAMLADPEIDAVYISLPNHLHAEWTVRAAHAGKHVLCEKPLAVSVAECDQIIAAAEEAGVVVMEAFMYLHHPLLRKVRQLVRDGAVGRVTLIRGSFSYTLDRPADVRWKPDMGGGSLWDVGSYPVSFIRWIAGEPEHAFGWQNLSESGVDVSFAGLLRYGDGTLASFDSAFNEQFRTEVEVVGTEGSLTVYRPFLITPETRVDLRRDYEVEQIVVPEADAYQCEVEALAAAALDEAALPVPLASSRANVATLLALYESAKRGEPQPIADHARASR
jgi:predicted dehydrogenase